MTIRVATDITGFEGVNLLTETCQHELFQLSLAWWQCAAHSGLGYQGLAAGDLADKMINQLGRNVKVCDGL